MLAQITMSWLALRQMRSSARAGAMYDRAEAGRLRFELVHSIAAAINSSLDLDHVMKTVADSMGTLFEAGVVAIWLADENGKQLRPAFYNSDVYLAVKEKYQPIDWDSSPVPIGEALRRRSPVIVGADFEDTR